MIFTHGNEIVGNAIKIFLENIPLKSGEIRIITANPLAYENFQKQNNPLLFRFVDHDLNRIWNDNFISESYEYRRREELKPMLLECDIIIDIHSVSRGEDILGIADNKSLEMAKKFMDVERILVQDTNSTSLTAWCSRHGKITFGLETGNHISETGKFSGIRNVKNLLILLDMLDENIAKILPKPQILDFLTEIKIETENFRFREDFVNFTPLSAGEIIGFDGEKIIKNPYNFDVLYGIIAKVSKAGRGIGFLFRERK